LLLDDRQQLLGDSCDLLDSAQIVGVGDGLHRQQVYHAAEPIFSAYRHLDCHGVGRQLFPDHLDGAPKVGSKAIHFVNETDPWHPIPVGLPPDRFRLRFHSCHGIKNHYAAIQNTQAALDFGGKVNVARCINDVDLTISPETGHGRGRDGDPPLPFLLHPIGNGCPIVHIAHPMRAPRVKEDALSRRRLTGVDVSNDADVSCTFERIGPGHGTTSNSDQFSNLNEQIPEPRGWSLVILPAIVSERPVCLRHLVRVFASLDGRAGVVCGVHQLVSQFFGHALAWSLACGLNEPTESQRQPAVR